MSSDSTRGHLHELYAERRRHREEVAGMVHELDLSRRREALLAQQAITMTEMAQLERQEVQRLQHLLDNLRARLAAATAPAACRCRPKDECDQGGDGYRPGPVS